MIKRAAAYERTCLFLKFLNGKRCHQTPDCSCLLITKMFLLPSLSGKKAGKEQLFSFQNQLIGVPHLPALTIATAIIIILIVTGLPFEFYKFSKFQQRKLNCIRFTLRKFSWGTSGTSWNLCQSWVHFVNWPGIQQSTTGRKAKQTFLTGDLPTFSAG